jgi:adenylosuccinate lyase
MKLNLIKSQDQYFSQNLMIALIQKRVAKATAYRLTQELSFQAKEKNQSLKKLTENNSEIKKYFNKKEIEQIFDIKTLLHNIDYIYKKTGIK